MTRGGVGGDPGVGVTRDLTVTKPGRCNRTAKSGLEGIRGKNWKSYQRTNASGGSASGVLRGKVPGRAIPGVETRPRGE